VGTWRRLAPSKICGGELPPKRFGVVLSLMLRVCSTDGDVMEDNWPGHDERHAGRDGCNLGVDVGEPRFRLPPPQNANLLLCDDTVEI
jgi:hypothetical protein